MIVLDQPTLKMELVLSGAVTANQVEINAWYFDQYPQSQTQPRSGRNTVQSNDTTDVTVVAAPGVAGIRRNIHTVSIYNKDTAAAIATVKVDDGTTERILVKQSLAAGDSLTYEHGNGWAFTTSTTAPFVDTTALVKGSADGTKQVRVEADGLSTATTRVITMPDYDVTLGNIPAGVIMDYGGSSVPTGWLECDGSAVSRTTYAALFTAVSTTWGTGDGSTTFNLPDFRGRSRIGKGTGTATESGSNSDVDTSADTLTVASNNTKWITGMSVVFTLSSGTITGLTSGNTYYVIRNSATLIKLASSLANAQNGTAIDLTAKSSPVWTITHSLTARSLAEQGGEQSHAMSSTELLSHNHDGGGDFIVNTSVGAINGGAAVGQLQAMASKGGNAAMNIMQPFAATMAIIKY